jgi:hypothetical protein
MYSPLAHRSLGAAANAIRTREWMDRGISVFHDMGLIPDHDTRRLLSALLLVDLDHAALSRVDQDPKDRRPYIALPATSST